MEREDERVEFRFVHRLSREKILEFMDLSPEEKLNWLEEANRFVHTFLDEERLKLWRKVRGCRKGRD